MTTDVTNPKHYVHYPICGFCMQVWDVIYMRSRMMINPAGYLEHCQWGGCDPDIWDYLDEETGYPKGWKIKNGKPVESREKLQKKKPPFDNRCFHRRADSSERAPWRRTSLALSKAFSKPEIEKTNGKKERKAKVTVPEEVASPFDEDIW